MSLKKYNSISIISNFENHGGIFKLEITRPVYLEVNLNNLEYNIKQIKNFIGKKIEIMPVVKANAYGTYINKNLEILNKFNIVTVANVDEAVNIRKLGYKKDIFVLNQPFETEIEKIIKYNIIVGICSSSFAKKLAGTNENVKVHIEIETGMGRTGVNPEKLKEYINQLNSNIKVEGIYTHFSSADIDDEFTQKQINIFNNAIQKAKEILGKIKYIHASASNGIVNYKEASYNLIRPGIILYGYPASNDTYSKIELKPIAQLKAKISFLKTVNEGTSIGYGRTYITTKQSKIATIPIGYADGFRRDFSNGWEVIINGTKVPIIGKICMDSFMADVTEIQDVKTGDEVIIWDNKNIKLEDLAKRCNTINYEILSTISERVPRLFVRN